LFDRCHDAKNDFYQSESEFILRTCRYLSNQSEHMKLSKPKPIYVVVGILHKQVKIDKKITIS
jgi:hypothetical protein